MRNAEISVKPVKAMKAHHVTASATVMTGEHIAHVRAALERYFRRDTKCIFDLDQSGILFKTNTCRSLRKGIGALTTCSTARFHRLVETWIG